MENIENHTIKREAAKSKHAVSENVWTQVTGLCNTSDATAQEFHLVQTTLYRGHMRGALGLRFSTRLQSAKGGDDDDDVLLRSATRGRMRGALGLRFSMRLQSADDDDDDDVLLRSATRGRMRGALGLRFSTRLQSAEDDAELSHVSTHANRYM